MASAQKLISAYRTADGGFTNAIQQLTIPELQKIIDKADVAYYRPGSSQIMEDHEYDLLRPALKNLAPGDERIDRVGLPFDATDLRNKVEHRIPMGSLDNTDGGIAGYKSWHTTIRDAMLPKGNAIIHDSLMYPEIYASLKIDGGSICATYEKGKLIRVTTRGNGSIGQDITVNGANFKNLPTVLAGPVTIDVRGEAVMYIDEYKAIRSRDAGIPFDQIPEADQSNPRNIGNGVFGRDDGQDSEHITFIAFNVDFGSEDVAFSTEEEKMKYLRGMGFQPVPGKLCKTVNDLTEFYEETRVGRDSLPFEIDGIVVVLNEIALQERFITDDIKTRLRPKFARAIKFPHKANTTTIEDVILSVGHTGGIYPTAVLKEVRIGGVNVTHALLNNWDEIERLGVAIGDEVDVILAGDVIPKIIQCIAKGANRTQIKEPQQCPSCDGPTTRNYRGKVGAVVYCASPQCCPEVQIGKVDRWIGSSKKGVGILNIGDGILKTIFNNSLVGDAADLYVLEIEQLEDLILDGGGRIGRSRAKTIVNNIAGKKHLTLDVFLGSLGIDLLGRRRVEILKKAAGGKLDRLEDWRDTEKLSKLQIEGFGNTIRDSVVNGMKESSLLIDKLLANGVTIDYPEVVETDDSDKPFAGLTFCFTGTRAYMTDVELGGGEFTSSVAKSKPSPNFLVQKDPLKLSNKTKNAEANGYTQIISLDFLKKVIDGEAELPKPQTVES